jgi:23S rRNA pseudouridine2457 synthase
VNTGDGWQAVAERCECPCVRPASKRRSRVLVALHKPYGVLSQFTPEPGSRWRTLAGFGLPGGVYPLGRLDADSEGLLLLSDEPGLNSRLLDPRHAHRREYWAQVERIPDSDALRRLERGGMDLGDFRTRPCRVRLLSPPPPLPPRVPPIRHRKNVADAWLALELTEGKNRQVRRMTAAVGHPTLRLIRVRIGNFPLGDLPAGVWRELDAAERIQVFAEASVD